MPLPRTPKKYESEESSTEDNKRKRWGEDEDDSDVSQRSKKTGRTPEKGKGESTLEKMMKDMMIDIKAIRNDQKEYQAEITKLKKENVEMKEKMKELERKVENMEKHQKKQNIIIKGYEFKDNEGGAEVARFISEKLEVEVKIKDVQKLKVKQGNPPMTIVKVDSWEEKEKIMKNKGKLKGTSYFVDHDLTQTEEKIQKELRDKAREEKGKGRTAKVGYQKIFMGNTWWKWNRNTEELEVMGGNSYNPKN